MKPYELIYIISGNRSETELATVKESVRGALRDAEVSITREEDLGKRRLAYPIGSEHFGYYSLVEFTSEASALQSVRARLTIMDGVARHSLTHKQRHAIRLDRTPSRQHIPGVPVFVEEGATAQRSSGDANGRTEAHEEVDIEALDKKLDELLEQPAA